MATSWHTLHLLCLLAFYNRWEYRIAYYCINIHDDFSTFAFDDFYTLNHLKKYIWYKFCKR